MELSRLRIENFKGIKEIEVDGLAGHNLNIYGDNRAGKTTVADAIFWLQYGKDSLGQTQFDIRPLKDGQPVHKIDTSVEGVYKFEDRTITLKKVYREKWTKKRGESKPSLTGNTTEHFVDDVPRPKKEFDAIMAEVCDENLFRLLTDPRYFNERMEWGARRDLLIEVCGAVTDREVIDSISTINKKGGFNNLINILNQRSFDEHKEMVKARIKKINEQLKFIPARIDELTKTLLTEHRDTKIIEQERQALQKDIDRLKKDREAIENGGAVAQLNLELNDVRSKISDIERELKSNQDKADQEKEAKESDLNRSIVNLKSDLEAHERHLNIKKRELEAAEMKYTSACKQWDAINAWVFTHEQGDTCPTCGQAIPDSQIEDARQKSLAAFNKNKAEQLEKTTKDGKAASEQRDELKNEVNKLKDKIEFVRDQIGDMNSALTKLRETEIEKPEPPKEYAELTAKRDGLSKAIDDALAGVHPDVEKKTEQINVLNDKDKALVDELNDIRSNEKAQKRINELDQEEKDLSEEYEQLESELDMIDQFTRAKVELMDQKINSKFKLARFKLFHQQVNGGLQDVCEVTTLDGVPYNAMNNAARICIGLDICETMAQHYGIFLPIVIDNAEAVTRLYETTAQQIRLYVELGTDELRIEKVPMAA